MESHTIPRKKSEPRDWLRASLSLLIRPPSPARIVLMSGAKPSKKKAAEAAELAHKLGSRCCLPHCYVQDGSKTDTGAWVKAECTNPSCDTALALHAPCFEKLESSLLTSMRRGLRQASDHGDAALIKQLWTTKYELYRSSCRCRCGAGFFRPIVDARSSQGAAATGCLVCTQPVPEGEAVPTSCDGCGAGVLHAACYERLEGRGLRLITTKGNTYDTGHDGRVPTKLAKKLTAEMWGPKHASTLRELCACACGGVFSPLPDEAAGGERRPRESREPGDEQEEDAERAEPAESEQERRASEARLRAQKEQAALRALQESDAQGEVRGLERSPRCSQDAAWW